MNWKILPVIAVNLWLCAAQVWACGFSDAYMYGYPTTNFLDVGLGEMGPHTIYPQREFETGRIYNPPPSRAQTEAMEPWFAMLGLPRATDWRKSRQDYELNYLVNKTALWELERLAEAMDRGMLTGTLSSNDAAQALVKSQNRLLLDYLKLIRELDEMECFHESNWSYEGGPGTSIDCFMLEDYERARTGYANADDPELKLRFAYQYIRLLFYNGWYEEVLDFFEKEIRDLEPSATKEWCRSFYAGSLARTGNTGDALLQFALVFHRSARYQKIAEMSYDELWASDAELFRSYFRDYKWMDNRPLVERQTFLALAAAKYTTTRERLQTAYEIEMPATAAELELAHSMRSYMNSDFRGMLQSALALHARGLELPYDLEAEMVKALNKLTCGSRDDDGLEELLLKVAEIRKAQAFWQLAAVHAAILRHDSAAAKSYMEMAVASGAEKDFPMQLLILQLHHDALLMPLDADGETALAVRFRQLDNNFTSWTVPEDSIIGAHYGQPLGHWNVLFFARLVVREKSTASRYNTGMALLKTRRGLFETVLAQRYLAAGQYEKAFFCLALVNDDFGNFLGDEYAPREDEFYTVHRSYELYRTRPQMIRILSDPKLIQKITDMGTYPQTPWEKYFVGHAKGFTPEVLYEMWGLACMLRHDFDGAIGALAKIQDAQWAQRRYNDKTVINPLQESHRFLFGNWGWHDDYKSLYQGARKAGLSKSNMQKLQKLTEPYPESFVEFARRMQAVRALTLEKKELGATAAYFYALGLYNMHTQVYWHHYYKYPWPNAVEDDIMHWLTYALENTKNPELKVRAEFMRGAVAQYTTTVRDPYYLYNTYQAGYQSIPARYDYEKYFKALAAYRDTEFGQSIESHCPQAGQFMWAADNEMQE